MPSISQQYFSLSLTVELFAIAVGVTGAREFALFVGFIGLTLGIVGIYFSSS